MVEWDSIDMSRQEFDKRRRKPVFSRGSGVVAGEFRTSLGQNCVRSVVWLEKYIGVRKM